MLSGFPNGPKSTTIPVKLSSQRERARFARSTLSTRALGWDLCAYAIVLVPVSETGTASPFHHACRVKLVRVECLRRSGLTLHAIGGHVVRVLALHYAPPGRVDFNLRVALYAGHMCASPQGKSCPHIPCGTLRVSACKSSGGSILMSTTQGVQVFLPCARAPCMR